MGQKNCMGDEHQRYYDNSTPRRVREMEIYHRLSMYQPKFHKLLLLLLDLPSSTTCAWIHGRIWRMVVPSQ